METKKSKKADLEWRKRIFFQLGVFMSLALVLLMFELVGAKEKEIQQIDWSRDVVDDDIIITTKRDPEIPKPKIVPLSKTVIDVINDLDKNTNDVDFGQDIDENTKIDDIEYIEPIIEPDDDKDEIFAIVEVNPSFPGGKDAFHQYLKDNIKYPRSAIEAQIEGTVYVEFVVEKDGSLTDIHIARKSTSLLDQEALRVIKAMPKWIPGKQRNKAVRVRFRVPIKFELSY
ncbi:MAG: energy transducer TonB [Bacteroidales bacterium]|jgi:protein TonB|nr:energy transducer TonB [Bacteroidales bacterium]MDD3691019.1 energy transducer TonB [Bacteroidales bacterium]MDD4044282.1 energy transducer TonB [Bacteroidales bacterium]MDD4581483.1 energy transducer TonB [Bacteroidales bacterium]MDX9889212.1 energy transducer TonB [Bacteroidales bacterium]